MLSPDIKIIWEGEKPDEAGQIEADIRAQIAEEAIWVPGKASDLVFHHHFVADDYDGPYVMLSGKEGDEEALYAEYFAWPQWKTMELAEELAQEIKDMLEEMKGEQP